MEMTSAHQPAASFGVDFPPRVRRVYAAHALSSVGSNLLIPAFFFYATEIFHWDSQASLRLVCAEGFVYILGALGANRLAAVAGRRKGLCLIQTLLGIFCAIAWLRPTPAVVVAVLLAYTLVSAASWPVFESLISAGTGARLLSRRIGVYNLIWSGVGTLTLAVAGTIINHFVWGMFFIPLASHFVALAILAAAEVEPQAWSAAEHALPEAGLLRQRRLALQLSRIGLPATYTVLYSLVALMPSLQVIRSFSPTGQTVVASLWMAARFIAFAILGATAWWHTRPRVLLLAAIIMLAAFLGVTLRIGHGPISGLDQIFMIAWQIPLGLTMGIIYSGSLYFGMVLSDGSTEHGGYHEALIGVGQIVGPAAALVAQRLYPDNITAAVTAVAAVLFVSLVAASAVTIRHGARSESIEPIRPPAPS
jgi:MFS family permease